MAKKNLLIRADANNTIGSGHIMRCLALAEAWQDSGGIVRFILADSSPSLEQRLLSESIEISHIVSSPGSIEDSAETILIARHYNIDWLVLDGYHFNSDYQKRIKESGQNLLVVDDYGHADHYSADIILNQNHYAEGSLYKSVEPYTQMLLGTDYVLLRKEFLKWSGTRRIIPTTARKVLVTLGGSDPDNVTLSVITALKQIRINNLEAVIVAGGINQNSGILLENLADQKGFTLKTNVRDMPALMAWADIAVSAGGSTCWEMLFMGLPNIIIIIAENQRLIAEDLQCSGLARNLGHYNKCTGEHLFYTLDNAMRVRPTKNTEYIVGSGIVDGNGGKRVITAMMKTDGVGL
jgi:UDP-2,4-diacetamido-2,4,6-trideoxy-beta-L-altropyranose hydrolase